MAGKKGQRSTKRTTLPKNYRPGTLETLDGRYGAVRALRGRWNQLAADLGGAEVLSYQEQSLLWRFVCLELWIESVERQLLDGKAIDETKWMSAINCFTGMISRIGLARRARPIQSLQQYLQQAECSQEGTNEIRP